ncbi:MAG: tRNA-dihydrouridine synthase [Bdellovibrionales bacterium]|nr:tRNA-dihydrouridine synthase [Bdellovibrionales bacterium]
MFIGLAPMEGVVDHIVRDLLTRIGGVDQCTTEFVRVTDRELPDHVFYRYCPELLHKGATKTGVPVFVQLLGSHPETMALNAQKAVGIGALGIDLNFGCPAKTVNRHDGGASLLKDPNRLFKVVNAVRQAVPRSIPVTAKVRLGFDHKEFAIQIASAVCDGGAQSLTIHARTRAELYRPPAHWEYISKMREAIKIPVLANGDIWNLEDYNRCKLVSGCNLFAIGRPLIARPDLALQIKAFEKNESAAPMDWKIFNHQWFLPMINRYKNEFSEHYALCKTKQWLRQLALTYPTAQHLFQEVKALSKLESAEEKLHSC